MMSLMQNDVALDDSDQDYNSEPDTPDTPISPVNTGLEPELPTKAPKSKSKSRGKYLKCQWEGCEKAFNRPALLADHERSHKNERNWKCTAPGCSKDFLRREHRDRHVQANHTEGPKSYVCKYKGCDRSFVTNQRLKAHHQVHEKHDKYTCPEAGCGEIFRKHSTLNTHVRTVHQGLDAFPCDEVLPDGTACPKGFKTAWLLKGHKNRDHGGKSYVCTICPEGSDRSLATYSELQTHHKFIHPPTCEECGYICKTIPQLAKHQKMKHSGLSLSDRKQIVCPYSDCAADFISKRNLKAHIRTIHEKSKPFACGDETLTLNNVEGWDISTACGKAFSYKFILEDHIRVSHLDLPTMQTERKERKKRKAEEEAAAAGIDIEIETSQPEKKKSKTKPTKTSKLDLIAGTSMTDDPRRKIPCPQTGCEFRFIREWDKARHLQAYHGLTMAENWIMTSQATYEGDGGFSAVGRSQDEDEGEDAAYPGMQYASIEEQLEDQARRGGRFWVGGIQDDDEYDGYEELYDTEAYMYTDLGMEFDPYAARLGMFMAGAGGAENGGEDVEDED